MEIKSKKNLKEKKFYEKIWFIVLMLIFFFPAGIYLMYKYKKFSSKARGCIVTIIVILGIIGVFTEDKQKVVDKESKQITQEYKEETGEEDIQDWQKNISLYGNILSKKFNSFSDAANKLDIEKMNVYSKSIVEYSYKLKEVKLPVEYRNAKNKINEACDIYIEIYGEMPNKCMDIEWVNKSEPRLNKANALIREASKEFKS